MRYTLFIILMVLFSLPASAQGERQQVRITSTVEGVTVALYNAEGKTVSAGKTPLLVNLEVDSVYTYRTRHDECYPDSGFLHIDTTMTELVLPMRRYQVMINWKINPEDADYCLKPLKKRPMKGRSAFMKSKEAPLTGKTSGQIAIHGRGYQLVVSKPDYRRYRQMFRFHSDSTVTISHDLQYCPKRLIVALNAGFGSNNCLPFGITLAYGGVHGIYGRYMQTLFNRADGDDFNVNALVDVLTNPYSDQCAEYQSFVVGYQYLTPKGPYLQLGLGYGTQHFNWLSADDGKRHRFAPDSTSGIIFDLGVGYAFGRYYAGAALQALTGGNPSFSTSCAMINLGVCL